MAWRRVDQGAARLEREREPRLIVKIRCVLVADVIEVDANGRQQYLARDLEEGVAHELFEEITGRPWTSAEITPARATEWEARPRRVEVGDLAEARGPRRRLSRKPRRAPRDEPRENAA